MPLAQQSFSQITAKSIQIDLKQQERIKEKRSGFSDLRTIPASKRRR
jgi:hypothetical protein